MDTFMYIYTFYIYSLYCAYDIIVCFKCYDWIFTFSKFTCYKISELRRLRRNVTFTHKMLSPDLKDLFQSVESAFYVSEDTEQLSFAANLLKAVQSEEIVSEINLLSDRLDFSKCVMVYEDEDPGTICALDVDIVFNKNHLGVVKRVCIQI